MSVLIKGMEMPTRCEYCGFLKVMYEPPRCGWTDTKVLGNGNARLDNCPLVSVPPHGLIAREQILDAIRLELAQANACNDMDDYDSWMRIFDYVRKFPTIIPADPAEEGET